MRISITIKTETEKETTYVAELLKGKLPAAKVQQEREPVSKVQQERKPAAETQPKPKKHAGRPPKIKKTEITADGETDGIGSKIFGEDYIK